MHQGKNLELLGQGLHVQPLWCREAGRPVGLPSMPLEGTMSSLSAPPSQATFPSSVARHVVRSVARAADGRQGISKAASPTHSRMCVSQTSLWLPSHFVWPRAQPPLSLASQCRVGAPWARAEAEPPSPQPEYHHSQVAVEQAPG